MAEPLLQSNVLKYLNALPTCIAENVSGNANQSGRADINCCYKGRCLKIELKDPETGYQPTRQQILYLKKWKIAGAIVGVCYSLEDVKNLLEYADMKFKEGMTEKQKIDALERQILVHSMIYYEMNKNVISDAEFDRLSRLLVKKKEKHGEKKMSKTQYWYVFKDFDGNTGFDLIHRLNKADKERIKKIAAYVLRLYGGKHEI